MSRNLEVRRADALIFMAYDAISLQRVTLNGKNQIRLIPTTQRKTATVLSVPYNG
jgi:hypothetical protein